MLTRWIRHIDWWGTWTVVLRLCGLAIVLTKAFSSTATQNPIVYLVACAMMGVSLTVPADRNRRGSG